MSITGRHFGTAPLRPEAGLRTYGAGALVYPSYAGPLHSMRGSGGSTPRVPFRQAGVGPVRVAAEGAAPGFQALPARDPPGPTTGALPSSPE